MKGYLCLLIGIFLVFVLLGVLVWIRPSHIVNVKEAKQRLVYPKSKFWTWKHKDQLHEIHYIDEGEPDKMPLVMVHGFGGSVCIFDQFSKLFVPHFRVIRVDLPGFGLSDVPRFDLNTILHPPNHVEFYRRFFSDFLIALQLNDVYLMGNSMGGGLAWLAAIDHPERVRKLILLNSAGYDLHEMVKNLAIFKVKSMGSLLGKGIPTFLSNMVMKRSMIDVSNIREDSCQAINAFMNKEGNLPYMLYLIQTSHGLQLDSELIRNIRCPTLIIWGDQDNVIPVKHAHRFHKDIPKNELFIYSECGHLPMLEKPEQLYQDVLLFISKDHTSAP
jgi:pimeloyl-ACP methyl ester carboxylesterase